MDMKSEADVRNRLVRHPKSHPHDFSRFCEVCSAKAINYNYGCITCESCKMFFRRNADKIDLVCVANGDCSINSNSRRHCSRCRLRKCRQVGMKKYVRDRHPSHASNSDTSNVSSTTQTTELSPSNFSSLSSPGNLPLTIKEEYDFTLIDSMTVTQVNDNFPTIYQHDYIDIIFQNTFLKLKDKINHADPSASRLSILSAEDVLYLGRLQEIMNFTITKEVLDESLLPCVQSRSFDDMVNMSDLSIRGLIKFFNSVSCFSQMAIEDQKLMLVLRIPCLLTLCSISNYEPPNMLAINTTEGKAIYNWEQALRSLMKDFDELPTLLKQFDFVSNLKRIFEDSFILISCVILMKAFEIHPLQETLISDDFKDYSIHMFEKHTELLFCYLYHLKGPEKFQECWMDFVQIYRWSRQVLDHALISVTKKISSDNNLTPLAAEIVNILHDKLKFM